ncbi:MAG: 16S rRNA (cytidine(1402)-2'-O)-methyltransferase [Clostridia bacterium]|nr:16S rRNA (cytidine(1402)-2'-O)-methyltransferase [Clostridia bacterium]MEE1025100.1 16S rRNA (cytidine(1402)-2'-O)-methyltransferase [Acutalibacteraceae bacterium]
MARLYVVGTPIGNLEDLSPRAIRILSEVDFIAAEDTRVTMKLLTHFGIKKPLVSYHEHNRVTRTGEILSRIKCGENCALVTDAGMPAISDPGEDLVRACREENVDVESVPGPTAFATAMAISGMSSGRFTFEGFLSVNKRSRKEHLAQIVNEPRTMIFYEAPHKLIYTLQDMYDALGDREIAVCREITKLHEQVIKTTLSGAIAHFAETKPQGEFVLVIEGAKPQDDDNEYTLEDAVDIARKLQDSGMPASAAAKQAASATGKKKGDIYKLLCE